jgi:hypothetical protein
LHSSPRTRVSRVNGATPPGRVTLEGFCRTAIGHGLLARSKFLEKESPEAGHLQSADVLELRIAERMVAAQPLRALIDLIANAWDALHNLFLLLAPSPPAVVDLVPAPNPGIPNEPSPIFGHLPEGEVSA